MWAKRLALAMATAAWAFAGLVGAEEGRPVFEAPVLTQECGVRLFDRPFTHTFLFTNAGAAPLTAEVAHRTCRCTSDVVSAQPVAPGASGELTVGFEPWAEQPRFGRQTFTVALQTNDPAAPEVSFSIAAYLADDAAVLPESLAFDGVAAGETREAMLDVYCLERDGSTPEAAPVECANPCLSIEEVERAPCETGMRTRYRVKLSMPEDQSSLRETITFHTTSPRKPAIECIVTAGVQAVVKASPAVLAFGVVPPDVATERRVTLTAGRALDLDKAECPDARFAVRVEKDATGQTWQLVATLMPGQAAGRPGAVKASAAVFDKNGQRVAEVPILGAVKAVAPR